MYAYALAKLRRRPIFLIVVGDLAGVSESVKVNSPKRLAYKRLPRRRGVAPRADGGGAPSFVNGQALYAKYARPNRQGLLTTTSTISDEDIVDRPDTGLERGRPPDPTAHRQRSTPQGVALPAGRSGRSGGRGHDVHLTLVGPIVGSPGEEERQRVLTSAQDTWSG